MWGSGKHDLDEDVPADFWGGDHLDHGPFNPKLLYDSVIEVITRKAVFLLRPNIYLTIARQ